MNSKKTLVGLVGNHETALKVLKLLQKHFGLPPKNSIDDIHSFGLAIIKPKDFKGLVSETTIRQLSNKIGASIPVNKHAGKKTENELEELEYLGNLADQYGVSGWAAKLFIDTDFFRQPAGRYVAIVTRQADSDFFRKDLGLDYKPVKIYDSVDDKPENESGPYVVVGGSNGKELKERIEKAFEKLENK